jgi:serine/threonine protein kinase
LGDGTFAVKCLTTDNSASFGPQQTPESRRRREESLKSDFEAEVDVLRRFSGGRAHPHLVSLLTTYKKGGNYHLLFHWAESDLLAFWAHVPPGDPLKVDNLSWMIGQCRGIANGVLRIHEYQYSQKKDNVSNAGPQSHTGPRPDQVFGRHTDIKPENFLLYRKRGDPDDRGTIKLTDFGLCEFHGAVTRSRINKSRIVAITPTYRPPECDMDHGLISRSFDIWSLGCVYLEFITWYLGGWKFLSKFANSRKAKDIHGHNADQFFEILTLGDPNNNKFAAGVKKEVVNVSSPWAWPMDCRLTNAIKY